MFCLLPPLFMDRFRRPIDSTCPQCTFLNPLGAHRCKMCGSPSPSAVSPSSSSYHRDPPHGSAVVTKTISQMPVRVQSRHSQNLSHVFREAQSLREKNREKQKRHERATQRATEALRSPPILQEGEGQGGDGGKWTGPSHYGGSDRSVNGDGVTLLVRRAEEPAAPPLDLPCTYCSAMLRLPPPML